jgi:hypothetical protein
MRTKVLICAAALAAASAFTSMAQNVYSLNVVGYINIPLVEGFQLIANQLDYDGTGTNNTSSNVLGTGLPTGSQVYTWSGTTYNVDTLSTVKGSTNVVWSKNYSLNPGQGAWLSIPAGGLKGVSANSNVTTVGQVQQGAQWAVNPGLPAAGGFSLLGSIVPLSGGLTTVLKYEPLPSDQVYQWDIATQGYTVSTWAKVKGGTTYAWSPTEPTIAISQGFWLNSGAGAVWSNYFTVQ